MSTATPCDFPLRNFQISAAARPAAATLACAAAATRNDDGSCGSSPVSFTASSAAASPPADVQISLRISLAVFISVALPYVQKALPQLVFILTRFFTRTGIHFA